MTGRMAALQLHAAVSVSQTLAAGESSRASYLGYPVGIEDKYKFNGEIGKGGNGVVRVVVNHETGEEFACKSIRKVLVDASEKKKQGHLDSIRREVLALTKLKGSLNIVKLEDVYEDDEHVHIVMELCRGGELWHRIGDSHYSERTVASFMRAVLRTLAQCHAQNILHRDIKPGNFMLLTNEDRAPLKAIDFGLAAPFDPEHLPRTDLGLEGTPWYMAPETLRGDWYPASDIWAAGVMAYQLLSGQFPFDDRRNPFAPAITAVWRSVMNDSVDFKQRWWSGISEEARDFCRLLLNRDVSARPTAKEALKHPWLSGNSSERSTGRKLHQSVVARIQRFAAGSQLKRTVLQSIAAELLSHPELVRELDRDCDRCDISETGRPIVSTPDSASLQSLLAQMELDKGGAVLDETQLGEALERLGFKLAPSEVSRLMEQVDLEGSGGIDQAAFAASQMDWRHLQKNHTELWLDLAAKAFREMDTNGDGVLEVNELLTALRERLPPDEVQSALQLALEEAGARGGVLHPGGGASDEQGIDFNAFCNLLKVGSMDTLDLYDDRLSSLSSGSVHGGSVDRLNGMLAASLRNTGDWSRHGGSRHGAGLAGEASTHSQASDRPDGSVRSTDNNNGRSQHGPRQAPGGIVFRFDVDRQSAQAASAGASTFADGQSAKEQQKGGSIHGIAAGGQSSGGGVSGGMVWRFDVGGPPAAPPKPPAPVPVWRFDVVGAAAGRAPLSEPASPAAGAAAESSSSSSNNNRGCVGDLACGGGDGSHDAQAGAAVANGATGSLIGRQGGYFDRRMHGSDLYRNVALKALQSSGHHRLGTVAE
ncbi:hypothetical protein VOLCADRAFT_105941 [Volvox carteri f. nagariensis]|uniref:Uncharacterized protein n=1 Tax=Volvox carteri f. nagariensis TaxID=3068 RepID=D8U4E1_VOLCA|nr:uncharacterized protein VOLCADRAFT_105941 [Volvox carteri f. nagariensis]EFJ45485.1 hypothetical protein VOLCADRAFT_105941 [Volvox carteri f. nagariensis]|eukprot:XP_002953512.1 hypothetical protein VOLCADRAFT_105941 [Volvox carteri f. nagariensis]